MKNSTQHTAHSTQHTAHSTQHTAYSILKTKMKFLFLCFLLTSSFVFCQNIPGIEFKLTPDGKLENVFDRYGNSYKLEDIKIKKEIDNTLAKSSLATPNCQSGIFNLYFENGSGMEGSSAIENERRAVVCQVFQDLSDFINTPLHNSGNLNTVNIWVRNISNFPNFSNNVLGLASGFYNLPSSPTFVSGGISDNEIWKTIHTGIDSYRNVVAPITQTSGAAIGNGTFYHGLMGINFNGINWNTNLQTQAANSQIDLYSVVLHEVTHALGFASLFNVTGSSNFNNNTTTGYNYFSRYDTFLTSHNGQSLLSNTNICNDMYKSVFNGSISDLHPGCAATTGLGTTNTNNTICSDAVFYDSPSTAVNVPVYTPSCFERGSSLSHFEDQCFVNPLTTTPYGNNSYFIMSDSNGAGVTKRSLTNEERQALCDIGYSLKPDFAPSQPNSKNYGTDSCMGIRIAGVNDGFVTANNITTYAFIGNAGTNINITGILNNDVSWNDDFTMSNFNNLRFRCLEDVYYQTSTAIPTTTLTQITANNDTSTAVINFNSLIPGVHLLRYVPFDNISNIEGNITYVYVFVRQLDLINPVNPNLSIYNCGNPVGCNLVINGDFEAFANTPGLPNFLSQINRACNWSNGNISASSDYFRRDATNISVGVPVNFRGTTDVNNDVGNAYVGGYISRNNNLNYNEPIATMLANPLEANTRYILTFDVSISDNYQFNQSMFQALLVNQSPAMYNLLTNDEFPIVANEIFLQNQTFSNNNESWDTITLNFTTGAIAGQQWLYIGGIRDTQFQNPILAGTFTGGYYYLDNVSLTPIDNTTLNLPATICDGTTIDDLASYVQNGTPTGVFSGAGVTLMNGKYVFNPTGLGDANYTINYTYTNGNCPPITINDNVSLTPIDNRTLNLPATICNNQTIDDLASYVLNGPPTGVFSGVGVTLVNGKYVFSPAGLGNLQFDIKYSYSNGNCPPKAIFGTVMVEYNCGGLPFISQVYVGSEPGETYIEIKNKSTTAIPAGKYYMNYYNSGADLLNTPTSSLDIGSFIGLETKVFKWYHGGASNPYNWNSFYPFGGTTTMLPQNFQLLGNKDLITLSTGNKYDLAYINRIDIAGSQTIRRWCKDKSIVRSSCATSYPKVNFDADDWVTFTEQECCYDLQYDENSKTNAALGRHHHDRLTYDLSGNWIEPNLPDNSSLPDRSREVKFFNDYNTGTFGSLEVCSLEVGNYVTVNVAPNTYASVQVNIDVLLFGQLNIENQGSLIMVKDEYNGKVGQDLIHFDTGGTVKVNKTTAGLDNWTDFVFWSSPLTDNTAINFPKNTIANLFPAPAFSTNYFYGTINENFYDGQDFGNANDVVNPFVVDQIPDGHDDNHDYFFKYNTPWLRNQLMKPGYGYCTLGLKGTSGFASNYTINFDGQPNNGVVTVPVYRNSGLGGNYNLVGNPYPCGLSLDKLFEVNDGLMDPVAFVWGRAAGDTPVNTLPGYNAPNNLYYSTDNYSIYSPTMQVSTLYPDNEVFNANGILSSCQSFDISTVLDDTFLPKDNSGITELAGNLIFNNSMRSTTNDINFLRTAAPKPLTVNDEKDKIWLSLTSEKNDIGAKIGIAFLDTASDLFNRKEDVKNICGNKLNFYSKCDNTDLVINALSGFQSNRSVPLGINNRSGTNEKMTIAVDKTLGAMQTQSIYLFDKSKSRIFNITNEPYNFSSEKSLIDDRFVLLFENKITTDISDPADTKVIVFSKNNLITINSIGNSRIKEVLVNDIYTPSIGGILIAKTDNINNKQFSFCVENNYKLLNVKIILEDGTVVSKKIMP